MERLFKAVKVASIIILITIVIITIVLAYYEAKSDLATRQKEQAILNYYQDTETLLDSLCIDCGDTIFKTNTGVKYLNSKYAFDSLFINNSK